MKKKRKLISLLLIVTLVIVASLPVFIFPKLIGYITKVPQKQVVFYFYDENNCSLNGYVFSGSKLLGKAQEGYFNLTYENYKANYNPEENISLFGKLEKCYQNSELLFDKYWKGFEINKYYFSGESLFKFKTKIIPHNPTKREFMGFIQPEKVSSELNKISIKRENVLEDLSEINSYLNEKINYSKDWDFNNENNYWQTPLETLELGKGDCEDFSTALLSLFLAYSPSLNCYNVIFSSHVTTFCQINESYAYFDHGKTELKSQVENKISSEETKTSLKELKEEYFEHYGINTTNKTEIDAHYAFSYNELVEFSSEEEFINWQYSLDKKSEEDIFDKLEQELSSIKFNETEQTEEELRTESVVALRTLSGFFSKNAKLIIASGIIFIILLAILIKINFKKKK